MPSGERDTAKELDEHHNSRFVPSADERINVPKLWVVEFYSPRHMKKLMESFRRFGWHGTGGMFEPPDMFECHFQKDVIHDNKSSKVNQDCTICRTCC